MTTSDIKHDQGSRLFRRIIATVLRQRRKATNLTQRQLADLAAMPQSTYSRYEGGGADISCLDFAHVCLAMGASAPDLLQHVIDRFSSANALLATSNGGAK